MKYSRRWLITLIVFTFFYYYLAFPPKAYAYIDAGTGSIIIQVLIGALVGGLFAIKLFWNQIKSFIGNLFSGIKKHEKQDKPED